MPARAVDLVGRGEKLAQLADRCFLTAHSQGEDTSVLQVLHHVLRPARQIVPPTVRPDGVDCGAAGSHQVHGDGGNRQQGERSRADAAQGIRNEQ